MTIYNPPDYPDYDLEQLQFYEKEIRAILQEFDTIIPEPLRTRIYDLHSRIIWDIKNRIDKGQTPAPPEPIDF